MSHFPEIHDSGDSCNSEQRFLLLYSTIRDSVVMIQLYYIFHASMIGFNLSLCLRMTAFSVHLFNTDVVQVIFQFWGNVTKAGTTRIFCSEEKRRRVLRQMSLMKFSGECVCSKEGFWGFVSMTFCFKWLMETLS